MKDIFNVLIHLGRKDDKSPRDLSSFQSTTFSGYLLRKKGLNWKNRWCVVKEHRLFCYKDFGIGTAELEVPLQDTSIRTLEENDPEKPHMFVLVCDKEELLFAAENEAELEEWITVLKDEIEAKERSSGEQCFILRGNFLFSIIYLIFRLWTSSDRSQKNSCLI